MRCGRGASAARILSSRLRTTRAVIRLIARLQQRPAVVVSGSAIGWYGLWQDETLTEFDGGKRCFTHRLCEAWEREARKAQRLGVRVVRLRIGLVLGIEGGMLEPATCSRSSSALAARSAAAGNGCPGSSATISCG